MQEREYKKLHTKKKENCPHFNFYSVFASHVQPDWICNSLTSPSPTSWCSTAALSSLGFDLSCMFSKFDFPRKKKTKRQCCRVACYTSKERDCSDRMVFVYLLKNQTREHQESNQNSTAKIPFHFPKLPSTLFSYWCYYNIHICYLHFAFSSQLKSSLLGFELYFQQPS